MCAEKKIMSKRKECDTQKYFIFDMSTHAANRTNKMFETEPFPVLER